MRSEVVDVWGCSTGEHRRRSPELRPTRWGGGGVRSKIPIFPPPPLLSFFFSLVDDDVAPPPCSTPFPASPPPRADGGGAFSSSAPFSKAPLLPARFIFAATVHPSQVTLTSAAEQCGPGRPGRKRLFWIKRQPSHRLSCLNAHLFSEQVRILMIYGVLFIRKQDRRELLACLFYKLAFSLKLYFCIVVVHNIMFY